jgi:serine/threonine protein kinase
MKRRSRTLNSNSDHPLAHMTFGHSSFGRSIRSTRLFLKKQLWIWPIAAVLLHAILSWGVGSAIRSTIEEDLRSELQTLLNVETSMLKTWYRVQEKNAESLANDPQVRDAAIALITAWRPPLIVDESNESSPSVQVSRLEMATMSEKLAQELAMGMKSHDLVSHFLADKQQRIIAAYNEEIVGQTITRYEPWLTAALDGTTTVSPPFPSVVPMKDEFGKMKTDVPTMLVCTPVRDSNFQITGVLAFRIRPEREFTRILQLGRMGRTGETYAFDKSGLMVSNSRFDERLILLGLIPDVENSQSILKISLRDPGGNMDEGFRPPVRRSELALTKMAASAIAGNTGIDINGYSNYKGIPSVGAWEWMPKYEIGVATEINHAEAFRPLTILQRVFYAMLALLALSAIAIFIFSLIVARSQREAQKAVIEAKHLGQYQLEERLGAGAMGVVYKGHHAMLRRPTAIKMLNVDKVDDVSIQRFEREVQTTCKLNHPSTVAIFDYGRTPEGVFYYAMEYLDGIDLQELVSQYGPQSEARVIRILKQVCGSLFEAHSMGLVHRDIKPANIMINRRGGESDVVKVLDFGLVRAINEEKQAKQSGGLSGTPLYMSPEAIQTPEIVDARSDVYAVGAVGYFLLTGQPLFNATTLVELCHQHVSVVPEAPSQRAAEPISAELENALLACLEKNPAKRPQTARDLSLLLDRSPFAQSWTIDDSDAWWGRHERSLSAKQTAGNSAANKTLKVTGSDTINTPQKPTPLKNSLTTGFDRTIDN